MYFYNNLYFNHNIMLIFFSNKRDFDYDEFYAVIKSRKYLQKLCIFSRESFKDDISWNRFLVILEEIRKGKILLQRKNDRLIAKIKMLKYVIKKLKKKNLITDSVENMSSDNYRSIFLVGS